MLMPSTNVWNSFFGDNMLDDFFGMRAGNPSSRMMSTDVKEKENEYEVTMNLPGFAKEDVKAELKDGYLTVSACTDTSNDTKDEDGRYIRRERYSGACSRSFYVGSAVTQEEIGAQFKHGVLKLTIPKKDSAKAVEQTRYIAIE